MPQAHLVPAVAHCPEERPWKQLLISHDPLRNEMHTLHTQPVQCLLHFGKRHVVGTGTAKQSRLRGAHLSTLNALPGDPWFTALLESEL